MVLGFQAIAQLQQTYGDKAAQTMLSQPAVKIFFGLSDDKIADWASCTLGEQEIARRCEAQSQGEGLMSKSSRSYHSGIKTEPVAIRAEIEGLPNFHGFIKSEKYVARIILAPTFEGPHKAEKMTMRPRPRLYRKTFPLDRRADGAPGTRPPPTDQ